MTPTEKARRSDALYYETVSVTRRVLCDAIANREADIDDLRKENARLRESVKRLMTQRDERLARAETDNAKLRELCEDMLSCIEIRATFGRPPTTEMYETFYKRARELEVDDD